MTNPYYYLDMIRQLEIKPGSLLVVTADVTRLALAGRRLEIGFDINNFIDTLKQCLGKGGTLVIPSFNFNLKQNDRYNPARTLPITGALAVAALKRHEFARTQHPLHSFLAWGEYADELARLENRSSFAKDSPFAFFHQHKAVMLLIDTSVTSAFTYVHHVEEIEKVKYRKFRRMEIIETGRQGDGKTVRREDFKTVGREDCKTVRKEVFLYAKKRGWTMDLKGLERILIAEQAARIFKINQIAFTLVDLDAAHGIIRDDIKNNSAANLAKFSLELYLRETAKSALAFLGIHTLADKISHDPGLL